MKRVRAHDGLRIASAAPNAARGKGISLASGADISHQFFESKFHRLRNFRLPTVGIRNENFIGFETFASLSLRLSGDPPDPLTVLSFIY